MSQESEKIIAERSEQYGAWRSQGAIAQSLKQAVRNGESWKSMLPCQRESIDMCLHKISRIVNGNYNNRDSWLDAGAYMQLTVIELDKGNK